MNKKQATINVILMLVGILVSYLIKADLAIIFCLGYLVSNLTDLFFNHWFQKVR